MMEHFPGNIGPDPAPIDTRRASHEALTPECTGEKHRAILDFIRRKGRHGATDWEISGELQIRLNIVGPRRCELRDSGYVVDSGHRRATDTGKTAIVWPLPAYGPGALAASIGGSGAAVESDCARAVEDLEELPPLPPRAVATGRGPRCRCGSSATVEVEISGNRTRVDCRQCGRFVRWGRWTVEADSSSDVPGNA